MSNTKYLTLVITHQCNLNCTYCYEKHKDDKVMTFEQAVEILDAELNSNDDYDNVEICLLGGEPLLEFDLIERIVEYTKKQTYMKSFYFFISTNGTLLDEYRKRWFWDNRKYVQMGLSLDGTKNMHDRNRCGSFDKIDINFFVKCYPEQGIKMTVSNETIQNLAEGVIYCYDLGFNNVSCNLAFGIDWSNADNERVFAEQLKKLVNFYVQNPKIKPCSLLDAELLVNISQAENKNLKVCGSGRGTTAYDFDGKQYPCQFFLPLSLGEETAKLALELDLSQDEIPTVSMDSKCISCCLRNICSTCYGANYAATGNIYHHDLSMCRLMKIQYFATAALVLELYEQDLLNSFDQRTKAAIVKSALLIVDSVSI